MKHYFLYVFLFLLVFAFSCKSKTQPSFEFECSVKKQDLNVNITQGESSLTKSSNQIIEIKKGGAASVIVPKNTKKIIRELYAHPKYKRGKMIDTDKKSIKTFTPGQALTLDLSEEPVKAVVRYFFCSENTANKNPAPCYPNCYESKVLVKIVD